MNSSTVLPPEGLARLGDLAWLSLAREHLARGLPLVVRASGLSMWPLVRPGQRVVVVPNHDFAIGDLVLVELGLSLVLHRVIELRGSRLLTKGDYNPRPDPELTREAVLGVVSGGPIGPWVARLSRLGGAPLAFALKKARVALGGRL